MVTKFPVFQRPLKCLSGTQGIELVREETKFKTEAAQTESLWKEKMELKSVQQQRIGKKKKKDRGLKGELI